MSNTKSSRRQFITTGMAAGSVLAAAPFVHAASKDKKYRTALIGSGWWGMKVLRGAIASGQTKVVALCDVDSDKRELAAEEVEGLSGDTPKTYNDYRDLLRDEKPEIVIVATPDHWHALNTIAALKAGSHVFVEKPTGHTIRESRAMVDAAKQGDRTVQVGLHRRIGPHHVSGIKFLRDGGAGKIGMVRAFVTGGGAAEMPSPNSEPPEGMDWDMYCGPAPLRPFNRKIHPGGFRNFLDFANGTLGDWGVHWLDQILATTDEKAPRRVFSSGGRPIRGEAILSDKEQTTDTPDSQSAIFEFESFTATWEHRQFGGSGAEKHGLGCYFFGSKGTFHMGWRDGWTFYPSSRGGEILHEEAELENPGGHSIGLLWADFLDSIRTGRTPAANLEIGHQATTMSLLGMLSLKLGRSVAWDGENERILDDSEANGLLSRSYREPWKYPSE